MAVKVRKMWLEDVDGTKIAPRTTRDQILNPDGSPFEETDPTVPQHVKDITDEDVTEWRGLSERIDNVDAKTVNGHTVDSDVPENAKFTDTTYSSATQSANGLMSSTDKTKLDGIDAGATKTVIQNNLTTTTTGYALDAVQGKELNEGIILLDEKQSINTTSGASLSLDTAKGGMRWQDEAIVGMTHKSSNLWDEQWESGSYDVTTGEKKTGSAIRNKNPIHVTTNSTICSTKSIWIYEYDSEMNLIQNIGDDSLPNIYNLRPGRPLVLKPNCAYIKFYEPSQTAYLNDIAIIEGISGSYEPYGIHSAGDMGCVDLGKLNWLAGYGGFYAIVDGMKYAPTVSDVVNAYCDKYRTTSYSACTDKTMCAWQGGNCVLIKDSDFASVDAFKTAITGTLLVYEPKDNASPDQYALVVEEVGKNLWNEEWTLGYYSAEGKISVATNQICTASYIKVKQNTEYYFNIPNSYMPNVCFYDVTHTIISRLIITGNIKTFTTPSNCCYITMSFSQNYGTIYKNDIIISEGSTATDYLPYSSKTTIIPISHPLRKVGDVSEQIWKDGKWLQDNKFGVVDISNILFVYYERGYYVSKEYIMKAGVPNATIGNILSEKYSTESFDNIYNAVVDNAVSCTKDGRIVVRDTTLGTDGHPTGLVIYEMQTPTTEPLPLQEAMHELESYAEQTHIDTADGLAEMNVEYGTSDLMAIALDGQRIAIRDSIPETVDIDFTVI